MCTTVFELIVIICCLNRIVVQCRPQQNQETQRPTADTSSITTPIPILSSTAYFGRDGSFNYSFQTANGINVTQSGTTKRISLNAAPDQQTPNEAEIIIINGSYSYTAPDGVFINITYTADENGYQAQGDSIPTRPPLVFDNFGGNLQSHNTTSTTTPIPMYVNPTA